MKRNQFLMAAAIAVALTSAGVVVATAAKRIPSGKWSGKHVNLTVTPAGFDLEFDCASGSAKGPTVIDRHGRFKLYGNSVSQPGSPSVPGESRAAEFSGSVKGKSMTLEVRLMDTKQSVGSYQLIFGSHQLLNKCPASQPQDRDPAPERILK